MNSENTYYFNLLKEKVSDLFLKEHHAPTLIKDWKGKDIALFQEDLFNKVKAKVSEKWFYTYFKNRSEKLPRIDMLNLLSNYVDYNNWNDFKASHVNPKKTQKKYQKLYWFLLIIPFLIISIYSFFNKNEFQFCLIDDAKGEAISNISVDIKILRDHESPIHLKTDSLGCFSYTTKDDTIVFTLQSPYHKTDTIVRHIDSNFNNIVKLNTDDYALMLDYYSNGKVEDWKKRKQELQKLIDDEALIYQLFKNNIGVEVYSKNDFIRMLTIPTRSLKRIKVIDKQLKNGKIVKLKFIVL